MEQQIAMPTRCNKCEELFDLTFDLNENGKHSENRYIEITQKNPETLGNLCWNCRIS